MIDEKFIYLGIFLGFIGTLSYLIDTLKGKVKPNKVTWFLWGVAPLIAFFAQLSKGVGLSSLSTLSIGLGPLLIFFASFLNKKSQWKITKFDIYCGALSVIGLILWGFTREGDIGIFFAILADLLAAVPTLVKSYKDPETENYYTYLFAGLSGLTTLLIIKDWNFSHVAFPLYIILICAIFFVIIKFKLGKKLYE